MSCALNRASRDFGEKDKMMLGLLTPHLINAIRNSLFVREMHQRSVRLESMLASVSRGVVRLGSDRRVFEISEPATRNLFRYFPSWKNGSECTSRSYRRLAHGELRKKDRQYSWSRKPFIAIRDGGTLRIIIVEHAEGEISLLMEERGRLAAHSLSATGLTRRESEILRHIESGNSDAAVATLCGISRRTVQKHVENIFRKLNVETRTAAVRAVVDSIENEL